VNERPGKGNRQIGSAGKKRTKCFNCEKPGHIKSECWAPGGGKEGQGPKQKGKGKASANAASTNSNRDSPREEFAFVTTMMAMDNNDSDGNTLVDSGASSHFCPDKSKFVSFVECKTTVNRDTADGRTFVATGRGDVKTTIPNGTSETVVTLKDTIYAPQMPSTLISISKLDQGGFSAKFGSGACTILAPNDRKIGTIPLLNGLCQTGQESAQTASVAMHAVTIDEAHQLLGHISRQTIRDGVRDGKIHGLTITDLDKTEDSFCEICAQSKPTRKPFPQEASNRAKELGGRIHADLWGPAQVTSLAGTRYTVDFTDDATRYTHIEFLKTKNQAQVGYCRSRG
jgi:hypothetical protein